MLMALPGAALVAVITRLDGWKVAAGCVLFTASVVGCVLLGMWLAGV